MEWLRITGEGGAQKNSMYYHNYHIKTLAKVTKLIRWKEKKTGNKIPTKLVSLYQN